MQSRAFAFDHENGRTPQSKVAQSRHICAKCAFEQRDICLGPIPVLSKPI
jgi:hypothetical protein